MPNPFTLTRLRLFWALSLIAVCLLGGCRADDDPDDQRDDRVGYKMVDPARAMPGKRSS